MTDTKFRGLKGGGNSIRELTETWKAVCGQELFQMYIFGSLKEAEDFAQKY